MYGSSNNATLLLLAQTVMLPALLSLGVLLLWQWRCGRERDPDSLLVPGAVLVGFWGAFIWIEGRFGLPPVRAMEVLPLFGVAGLAVDRWVSRPRGARPASRVLAGRVLAVVALAGLLIWLLQPVLGRMPWTLAAFHLSVLLGSYLLLAWMVNRPTLQVQRGALLMSQAAISAPVIALGGSLKLGQMSGALAAALGGAWLVGLIFVRIDNGRGEGHTALMLLVAVFAAAYHYADVSPVALFLIPASVLLALLVTRHWPWEGAWKANLRVLALSLLPLAAALWVVWPEESLY